MAFGNLLEHARTQSRRERERQKGRESNGQRHGECKLTVNITGGTAKHRQRHKHRNQHRRDADNRAGNLAHGFFGGFHRRQTFFGHNPLDVFHHHNGIIHHNTNHQHHRKHAQHVDRHAQIPNAGKSAQQGNRHHNGRNQRIADILQKQEHHQKHQHHCLNQCAHHFLNRKRHKSRGVIRSRPSHIARKIFLQFSHLRLHSSGGGQSIAAIGKHHSHAHGGLAVEACGSGIALTA